MLTQAGWTALIFAAAKGHASVVTLLLDAKVEVNLADNVRQPVEHFYDDAHTAIIFDDF
jgi:ankyrin repeat protein